MILQAVTFVRIGEFEPLPAVRIKINDYATLKLAESLGIAPGVWLKPMSQYHLESVSFSATVPAFENQHSWWEWWWWP